MSLTLRRALAARPLGRWLFCSDMLSGIIGWKADIIAELADADLVTRRVLRVS